MRTTDIEPGDRVRDPLDGQRRTVARIEGDTVHLEDGGVMGRRECADILLPGERDSGADADDGRVTKLCATCRQPAVVHDAWAEWCDETQQWVLQDHFDMAYCRNCEGETSVVEAPLAAHRTGAS